MNSTFINHCLKWVKEQLLNNKTFQVLDGHKKKFMDFTVLTFAFAWAFIGNCPTATAQQSTLEKRFCIVTTHQKQCDFCQRKPKQKLAGNENTTNSLTKTKTNKMKTKTKLKWKNAQWLKMTTKRSVTERNVNEMLNHKCYSSKQQRIDKQRHCISDVCMTVFRGSANFFS